MKRCFLLLVVGLMFLGCSVSTKADREIEGVLLSISTPSIMRVGTADNTQAVTLTWANGERVTRDGRILEVGEFSHNKVWLALLTEKIPSQLVGKALGKKVKIKYRILSWDEEKPLIYIENFVIEED